MKLLLGFLLTFDVLHAALPVGGRQNLSILAHEHKPTERETEARFSGDAKKIGLRNRAQLRSIIDEERATRGFAKGGRCKGEPSRRESGIFAGSG